MTKKVLMRMDQVARTYVMGHVEVEALRSTSLDLYEGELLVILGPSGSGKSTLLNLIGGIDIPTKGRIYYRDAPLGQAGESELTSFRRSEVGFVFQFYNLINDLTARENVELAADLVSRPLKVDEVMEEVGLGDRLDHFPTQLSGGEQQRVAIARAVIKNAPLLLCDEPTGALDHQTGKQILSLLAKFNRQQGSTVIIVTHNTAIGAMAHRLVRMSSGRIVEVYKNASPESPERIEW